VKISIDTEQDSYDSAAAALRAAYGIATPDIVTSGDVGQHEPVGPASDDFWNHRERLTIFANGLAPDAAEAVRYIAAHPPEVSVDEVIEYMGTHLGIEGFSGQQMGGRMASVGFSWKNVPGADEAPMETDYRYRRYYMDERIAAILREIMGEPGQPKRGPWHAT
jgi:hypothetical protein